MKIKTFLFYLCCISLVIGVFAVSPIMRHAQAASTTCYDEQMAKGVSFNKTLTCSNVQTTVCVFQYSYGGATQDTIVRTTIANDSGKKMICTALLSLNYRNTIFEFWQTYYYSEAKDNVNNYPGFDTIQAVATRKYDSKYKKAKEDMKVLTGSVEGNPTWCQHSIETNAG